MNEYIGKSGRITYIVSRESEEACSFNSFGEKIEMVDVGYAIVSSKFYEPVDILSVLGEPVTPVCEIYFNNEVAVVKGNYFDVYHKLKDLSLMMNSIPLRIPHESNVMQLLIPYRKGAISKNYINSKIPNLKWEKLSK